MSKRQKAELPKVPSAPADGMAAEVSERPEETQDHPIILAADTLAGDLRDFVLDRLKHDHNPLPWDTRPEAEQRETVAAVEGAVRALVHRACALIASGGQRALRGTVVKAQIKDGIQIQVNVAGSDPLRHALLDHMGNTVLVVIADAGQFMGERAPVPVNRDQKSLLDDDGEREAA